MQTAAAGAAEKVAAPGDDPDPSSHFVAVGVVGSAVRADGAWDASFGGELVVGALAAPDAARATGGPPGSARRWLAGWALGVGAAAYSERDGGRGWLQLGAGTRRLGGVLVGVAAGPLVELAETRHARWGGQASLWLFAGVTPYAQISAVTDGELAVDVGLRLPLPAVRW